MLFVLACGHKDASLRSTAPVVDSGTTPSANDGAVVSAEAGASPRADALTWLEALRVGRYADAAEAMAGLSSSELAKPEVRLARARVLIATGKSAEALAALERVDDELPLLLDLVARTRAQAMLEVGPYEKAAEYFGARRDVSSWILAAEAWEKAGDGAKARAVWDRV
ncbi:MAG TPA: hypothetical protein VM925_27335, partial [Labilithrix sp.]|nr:hypothetical protein [Labilithrix sp.]